jgi:hypothetical protein
VRINVSVKSVSTVSTVLSLFALLFGATIACGPLISPFDHTAYEYAISLKVESLALMDKAAEPYVNHEREVKDLMLQVEKAYEYAKGRPKNEITAKQWEILKDPDRNLLGGFMKYWREKSQVSNVFIKEAKGLVADAFDMISGLESKKLKLSDIK